MSRLNDDGHEVLDPTPMALPAGFRVPETLAETVRRLVRSERWAMATEQAGVESFDEANDFDIPDDPADPATPFEPMFDPALGTEITAHDLLRERHVYESETSRRVDAAKARKAAKEAAATAPPATPPPATPPVAPESE